MSSFRRCYLAAIGAKLPSQQFVAKRSCRRTGHPVAPVHPVRLLARLGRRSRAVRRKPYEPPVVECLVHRPQGQPAPAEAGLDEGQLGLLRADATGLMR